MGISSTVIFRVGGKKRYSRTQVLKPNAQQARMAHAARRLAQEKRNLSWEQRDAYADLNGSRLYNLEAQDEELDDQMDSAPFGEEGVDLSHGGHDHEVFENVIVELAKVAPYSNPRRYDYRHRYDRTLRRIAAWATQMEELTNAYLAWSQHPEQPLAPVNIIDTSSFSITCIDVFEITQLTVIRGSASVNVSLVQHGALGCAPHTPSLCFTLRTLEEYRQARRFNPRITIQSQVRKFCGLHNVPFRHSLTTQFSIAYDAYLEIQRRADERIKIALGQSSPNWRLLNSCPACEYRLYDETPLAFSKLIAIDGNNSLRRIDPSQTKATSVLLDTRDRTSDVWIKPADADKFKNEVRKRTQDPPEYEVPNVDVEGDVTDSLPEVSACAERWRAAGPERHKQMWRMFKESGIFIAVCRHGFLLLLCDMIQSGELAKYPLALVDCLLDVYGPDLAIGYDIGCAFASTIQNSQLLRDKAARLGLRMLVPSFHGHAHNRACQVAWHPMYIPGTGLEDFETCERVFSQSNALAAGTRHASSFHRVQAIEEYFKSWDEEKYANLSQFLYNNYVQALKIISEEGPLLDTFSQENNLTPMSYETFLQEEREYLQNLKTSRPRPDELHVAYVKALEELECCESDYYNCIKLLQSRDELNQLPGTEDSIGNISRQISGIISTRSLHLQHVLQLESTLGIQENERWGRDHPLRMATADQLNHQSYCQAVDHLERLVVMRLFELTKLNQSSTAYKMRRHIQKQLTSRSDAIKKAVKKYNKAASLLEPPRPQLKISDVLEYTFLGEFDLLKNTREDIRSKAWTSPLNREYTQRYFKIQCACEEIIRLNVEIRRLITSIKDECIFYPRKITELQDVNPPLAHAVDKRWKLRHAINQIHLRYLSKIQSLPGFSGTLEPGKRTSDHHPSLRDGCLDTEASLTLNLSVEERLDDKCSDGELSEDDEIVDLANTLEQWHDFL